MQRKRKAADYIFMALFALLLGLAVWAVTTADWEARHWDNLDMDMLVGQLATPVEGTGRGIIDEFINGCVVPAVVTAVCAGALLYLMRYERYFARLVRAGTMLGISFFCGMLGYAYDLLGVSGYVEDINTESAYIEDNYVDPRSVRLTFPEQKRNLIYIWLESMESTFCDEAHGGAFPENVIPGLTKIAEQNVSFTGDRGGVNGAYSVAGTTWTMGATFAQTSGLPLKIPLTESSMDSQDTFFPNMVNLGDILEQNGYQQAYLIGSDGNFAGRKLYFEEHGNYTVWDHPYSLSVGEIPEGYNVWWGYEDVKLFEFAKKHLTEMAASGQPFNLSILTADTHFPNGYVCPLCHKEHGSDQYSNVMSCSSRQVHAFVRWLERQDFYENTTVILCGDHITMNVGYCADIDPEYTRHVYTTILNPAAEVADPTRFREYSSMDLFPTTLAAMGVEIPGDRLGLGVNLFSDQDTLVEKDGFAEVDRQMKRRSAFVDSLSGIDERTYELSEVLRTLDTGMEAVYYPNGIRCTLHGLAPYEKEIEDLGVFAEKIEGNTRTTLSMNTAFFKSDGTYTVRIPYDGLEDYDEFLINIYATIDGGRIKVDAGGYRCDQRTRTIWHQEAPEED